MSEGDSPCFLRFTQCPSVNNYSIHKVCRLGRADNSKTVPAPIHRPNFRAMTFAMFTERNPTFLKPPAFPTNSHTIARCQILNLPFHVSIGLLLMFADWLPGHLKNIQPLIVRSAARDACIVLVGWVGIKGAINRVNNEGDSPCFLRIHPMA